VNLYSYCLLNYSSNTIIASAHLFLTYFFADCHTSLYFSLLNPSFPVFWADGPLWQAVDGAVHWIKDYCFISGQLHQSGLHAF
jgi:hypothetical protein